jgi:Domain of unknown function (DUF4112)
MAEHSPQDGNSIRTRVKRLREYSRLLDSAIAIPGTGYRFGLDPIIGLVPGGGDTVGLVLSAYILYEAAQLGAAKGTLGQMAFNILLETVAGSVPVLGDIFDVTWKANVRNVRLLEDHLKVVEHHGVPGRVRRSNQAFMVLLLLLLVLAFIGAAIVSFMILRWVVQILTAG